MYLFRQNCFICSSGTSSICPNHPFPVESPRYIFKPRYLLKSTLFLLQTSPPHCCYVSTEERHTTQHNFVQKEMKQTLCNREREYKYGTEAKYGPAQINFESRGFKLKTMRDNKLNAPVSRDTRASCHRRCTLMHLHAVICVKFNSYLF